MEWDYTPESGEGRIHIVMTQTEARFLLGFLRSVDDFLGRLGKRGGTFVESRERHESNVMRQCLCDALWEGQNE